MVSSRHFGVFFFLNGDANVFRFGQFLPPPEYFFSPPFYYAHSVFAMSYWTAREFRHSYARGHAGEIIQ